MRKCFCGSTKRIKIWKDVVICENCRFAFNGNCTQKDRTDYYKAMEKKTFYLGALPMPALYIKQQDRTADFIKKYMQGKALDIGCYTGEIMRRVGGDIEGLDPSRTAVRIARKAGLNVELGDVFTYKFKKRYDTIILSHVIEHIVDLRKFILIISELLNPGGVVIIETPDATRFTLEKGNDFINDQKEPFLQFSYEHVNYFTPYSLKNLFVNFRIVSCAHALTTVHALRMVFKKKTDLLIEPSLKMHIKDSLAELWSMNDVIRKIDSPIYVWGVGAFTRKLIEYTELASKNIVGFIDDIHREKKFMGIPIVRTPEPNIPILVGTMQYKSYVCEKYKNYKLITL